VAHTRDGRSSFRTPRRRGGRFQVRNEIRTDHRVPSAKDMERQNSREAQRGEAQRLPGSPPGDLGHLVRGGASFGCIVSTTIFTGHRIEQRQRRRKNNGQWSWNSFVSASSPMTRPRVKSCTARERKSPILEGVSHPQQPELGQGFAGAGKVWLIKRSGGYIVIKHRKPLVAIPTVKTTRANLSAKDPTGLEDTIVTTTSKGGPWKENCPGKFRPSG